VIAFAVRKFIQTDRPDTDPEYTRMLVHVFLAAERARRHIPALEPSPPLATPEPEAPRQAA
jgi:hypothetical protein